MRLLYSCVICKRYGHKIYNFLTVFSHKTISYTINVIKSIDLFKVTAVLPLFWANECCFVKYDV